MEASKSADASSEQQGAWRGRFSLASVPHRVERLTLYKTKQRLYVVGSDMKRTRFRLFKVDRSSGLHAQLEMVEDAHLYDRDEMSQVLGMLNTMGLEKVCVGYGVLGVVRFLQGWNLLLITKRRLVGVIGRHKVYAIDDTVCVQVGDVPKEMLEKTKADEARYRRLFFGLDLSNFYFSYSYDLTRTLQYNMANAPFAGMEEWPAAQVSPRSEWSKQCDEKWTWNLHLAYPVLQQLSPAWFLPVIHGYFKSSAFTLLFDQTIRISLISRRSRHFAGTRYLKRGIDEQGHVANDVETEQVVEHLLPLNDPHPVHFSSFVQVRGSIPLFWSQDNSLTVPKPDITVYKSDPFHNSAIRHFQDLFRRYGCPLVVLNLIKQREKREREIVLLRDFTAAIGFLNETLPPHLHFDYIAWDFHQARKNPKEDVISSMIDIARTSLQKTGFFHTGRNNGEAVADPRDLSVNPDPERKRLLEDWFGDNYLHRYGRLQEGVLRSNCIDSLDRTNATQFCIGTAVLGEQLYAMGLTANPVLEFQSSIVNVLLNLYEETGDAIALQYAGSQLAHRMNTYKNSSSWSSASKDLLTSIKRYYTSTFTDAEKQSAINLFLGKFRPYESATPLWALPSDYSLHMGAPPHTRPLASTQWWREPLETFERNIASVKAGGLAVAQSEELPHHQSPRNTSGTMRDVALTRAKPSGGGSGALRYSMEVSAAFKTFYKQHKLTSFDLLFARPFFRTTRVSQQVVVREPSAKTEPAAQYAQYLKTFTSWVAGGNGNGIASAQQTPIRRQSSLHGAAPLEDDLVPPKPSDRVQAEGHYRAYLEYPEEEVWEPSHARADMQEYLRLSHNAEFPSLSADFAESRHFYTGYLFTAETHQFQPRMSSMQLYDEMAHVYDDPLVCETIDEIKEEDYPALFVDSISQHQEQQRNELGNNGKEAGQRASRR